MRASLFSSGIILNSPSVSDLSWAYWYGLCNWKFNLLTVARQDLEMCLSDSDDICIMFVYLISSFMCWIRPL